MIHEYLNLLQDIPHWCFELTVEFVTGVLIYPFAKWFWDRSIKKHDEEFHPDDIHERQ